MTSFDSVASTKTQNYAERARAVIPGGVNSGQRQVPGLEEFVVTGTAGATIRDDRGNTYVDYHAAFGPPLLGHNDPDVDAAVVSALRDSAVTGVGVTPREVELAEQLTTLWPSFEQVLLTSTGSEATFSAVRLARAATGRRTIAKFQGCFHGSYDSLAMNVISRAERVGHKDPLSTGILQEVIDETLVLRFNDLDEVRRTFDEHRGEIAAVIVEPIPHNVGALIPKAGFLEGLRELCDRDGVVLIFDEVITGFRHAVGGYQSIIGVVPDLTTVGKAMANGYPIGALGGRRDLMEMFSTTPGKPVMFAGTFNGHPVGVTAALATIDKLSREPVHEHIFELGERARRELRDLFKSLGVPAVVSGFGSVWVTYFLEPPVDSYDDLLRNDVEMFVGYRLEQIKQGIFELPLNLKRNHFSYAHTSDHVDELLATTERSVRTVLDRRRT